MTCQTESLAFSRRRPGWQFDKLSHASTGNAHSTAPGRGPQLTQADSVGAVYAGKLCSHPRRPPAPANATRRGAYAFLLRLLTIRVSRYVWWRPDDLDGNRPGGGADRDSPALSRDTGPGGRPRATPRSGPVSLTDGHPRFVSATAAAVARGPGTLPRSGGRGLVLSGPRCKLSRDDGRRRGVRPGCMPLRRRPGQAEARVQIPNRPACQNLVLPDPAPPDWSAGFAVHFSPRTRACARGHTRTRTGLAILP